MVSHILPEDIGWRWRNIDRIQRWLTSNRIDPNRVPIDSPVVWDSEAIVYSYYDADNPSDIITMTTALVHRWSAFRSHGPDRLCINGQAYSGRRKRRTG